MTNYEVNQFGDRPLYIERNEGVVYISDYVAQTDEAFADKSFELHAFTPKITPPIQREEVKYILDWISKEADKEKPNRVALLYGNAGVGKSVVMHDVLLEAEKKENYLVLGLKIDQIEFEDIEGLRKQMHLAKPLVSAIKDMAQNVNRVVILIDQIDALSLSLSSNRTPLRSVFKLIEQVKQIPHVRVVISCRPYDLEYDPILNDLKIKTKWELKKLTTDKVKEVLKSHGLDDGLNDQLLNFLGNPLYLYLYLKVGTCGNLRNPITEEVLYNELWRIFIVNIEGNNIYTEQIIQLLDTMVKAMYKRQELSIHRLELESNYHEALNYLLSKELLLCSINGRVQFFHQTMFDYVYARRFVEKGLDLMAELSQQHQGLFSRAAVKSIFNFLRETNPVLYKQNMDSLLFDEDAEGHEKYRFHLKSLVLSNMAFFEEPKHEELLLIERKIFNYPLYMGVIFESVHNGKWLDAIWKIIENKGGWGKLSKEYRVKAITMCSRTLWSDADKFLKVAFEILLNGDADDRKLIIEIVNHQPLQCHVDKLVKLYHVLNLTSYPMECTNLLKLILVDKPAFVIDILKDNILKQLENKEQSSFHRIELTHEEKQVYESLESKHHDLAVQLYVDILKIVMEKTRFDIPGHEIISSFEFSFFQRSNGVHFSSNFVEDVVNKLIDDFLKNTETDETQKYLQDFSQSKFECFVFIALFVFTQFPDRFSNDIYMLITQRSVLTNAPSWVEYQALEALKTSFLSMTIEQQKEIVLKAISLTDEGEHQIYSKELFQSRLQAGYPLFDFDIHRGKVLHALPKKVLANCYRKAYLECLRIERKFGYNKNGKICYSRLDNEKPFQSSCGSGWASLGMEKAMKMSCKAWAKSMTTYTDNRHSFDWNRPSLEGQSQLFRQVVSCNPEKYLQLLKDIVTNKNILLCYAESGLSGLLDAKRYMEAEHVFCSIVREIEGDVNSEYRGFGIHSFLYVIDTFLKANYMPRSVFDFLCNAVLYAKESDRRAEDSNEKDIYNTAINQARGHAASLLVECSQFKEYQNEIFETLEKIAATASVYTRSAILLNMAVLNLLDKSRNVSLFKKLLHDYDARLMAMPVHNYNPLVYFVNYAVDDIMDVFVHALNIPACYEEQVIFLWLAWSHNNHREDIKQLLNEMCEKGENARLSLLKFLTQRDVRLECDVLEYVLYLISDRFYSLELGKQCDAIFRYADKWSKQSQEVVTNAFVSSRLCGCADREFMEFLAGYAITEPIQALHWLECVLSKMRPKDYGMWNLITDVLIQSYNGVLSFKDKENQPILEKAMDLMDGLMKSKDNRYLITNFIRKLDEE